MRYCETCKIQVPAKHFTGHLRSLAHKQKVCEPWEVEGVMLLNQAFKNRLASYRIEADGTDVSNYLQCVVRSKVIHLLESALDKHGSVKTNLELFGLYTLPSKDIFQTKSFITKNYYFLLTTEFEDTYEQMCGEIIAKAGEFEEADSGWALVKLLFLEVNICKLKQF